MIGAINNSQFQNKTNFGAVIPVRCVHVNGGEANLKQCESAVNHTINILMKKDKDEPKNMDVQKINGAIRAKFQSKIEDYIVPPGYHQASREILETPKFIVRQLEDKRFGQTFMYLLTGKHARKLEEASMRVKEANKIRPPRDANGKISVSAEAAKKLDTLREKELRRAKESYGETASNLLSEAHWGLPSIEIFGRKEKSGKITPLDITF